MTEFLLFNLGGIAIGVVLKTMVPMPFIDRPIHDGWSWLWNNTLGRL